MPHFRQREDIILKKNQVLKFQIERKRKHKVPGHTFLAFHH
ncbi:hypothetical protein CHCC14820_0829 [Bacillus paralicheniformis]|nr:hypothetical protein CHCC14820_0829 [Bacillus paralicheniformis]